MRIFTFFVLILNLMATAHADVYEDALEVRCSAYESVAINSLTGNTTFTSSEQSALLCDSLKEISDRYVQTTVRSFEEVFTTNLNTCLNTVSVESVDSWQMNSLLMGCYALFQDGHLTASMHNTTLVFLPFSVREIDERFYISGTGFSICDDSDFRVGDEIILVGGETLKSIKENLTRFVSASSQGARAVMTDRLITQRNFEIPLNGNTEIILSRDGETVSLQKKWLFYESHTFATNEATLLERGYQFCNQEIEPEYRGYYSYDNLYPSTRSQAFYMDVEGSDKFLTISRPVIDGRRACYLKLVSFNFEHVYHNSNRAEIWNILTGFVEDCARDEAPFILDLRSNGGGYIHNMIDLVNLFATEATEDFVRRTFYSSLSLNGEERVMCYGVHPSEFASDVHSEMFFEAFCRAFEIEVRSPDGYSGNIYMLSSEECMSACDYALTLLSAEDNVVRVGSTSHGAMLLGGADVFFEDRTMPYGFQIFNMAPYYFVGVDANTEQGQVLVCNDNGLYCLRQFEGAGVAPDEIYTTTYRDLVSMPAGAGWRERVESLIREDAF